MIGRFEIRTRQLILKHEQLKQQNASLQEELSKKEESLLALSMENKELREDYAHLKMAKYIDLTDDGTKQMRRRISKMIRDIDKCIAMLKSKA